MGEAVVAPGTPDAVRHHDPRKDRQRGPARRLDLGEERGGFKGDAARRGSGANNDAPEVPVEKSKKLYQSARCRRF